MNSRFAIAISMLAGVAVGGLAVRASVAASGTPKLTKGMAYAKARSTLLAQGWTPVIATAPGCEPGREDVCARYPETQSCAGTGYGICTFDFRSASGALIQIVTHGGKVGQLTVSEVIECPRTGCD